MQKRPASGSEELQNRFAAVSGAASSSGQGAAPVSEDAARAVSITMGQMPMEKYQDGMDQLNQVITCRFPKDAHGRECSSTGRPYGNHFRGDDAMFEHSRRGCQPSAGEFPCKSRRPLTAQEGFRHLQLPGNWSPRCISLVARPCHTSFGQCVVANCLNEHLGKARGWRLSS